MICFTSGCCGSSSLREGLLVAAASSVVGHQLPNARASLVVVHGLSCPAARDLPGSGIKPALPHWLAYMLFNNWRPGKPRTIILEQSDSGERVYLCSAPPPAADWVETRIHPSCLIILKFSFMTGTCPPSSRSPGVLIFPAALCCPAHTSVYSAVPMIPNVFSCFPFCFVFESCCESPYTYCFFVWLQGKFLIVDYSASKLIELKRVSYHQILPGNTVSNTHVPTTPEREYLLYILVDNEGSWNSSLLFPSGKWIAKCYFD